MPMKLLLALLLLQADSATVKAHWPPAVDALGQPVAEYTWNAGGDTWAEAGTTLDTLVSFRVARPAYTDTASFCYRSVSATNGLPSPPRCATFVLDALANPDTLAPPQPAIPTIEVIYDGVEPPPTDSLAPGPSDVVVFEDGFESGGFSAWATDGGDAATKFYVTTAQPRDGTYSLEVVNRPSHTDQGELIKWFTPGHDELYVSFDLLFDAGFALPAGHFVGVEGNREDNLWSASGQAGVCPSGTDYFQVVIEPAGFYPNPVSNAPWIFYNSWVEMEEDPISPGVCWGNVFEGANYPTPGTWQRIVLHIKLNTVGQANGFARLYINGERAITQSGVRWRTGNALKLNELNLFMYLPEAPAVQRLWVDNVVVWHH